MSRVYYPSARAVLNVKLGVHGVTAEDAPTTVIWTTPKAVTVHRNRSEMADSFELTFDERDCPFDPSTILAGEASIYLYDDPGMLAKDRLFNRSNLVQDKTAGDAQHQLELRQAQFTFEAEPTIVGLFDDIRRDMGTDGREVTIQGQDYTALLLERQWPPAKGNRPRRLPTGKRLDVVLRNIIAEVDPSGTLQLTLRRVTEDQLPIVRDEGINRGKTGIPVESETKYWDAMVKLTQRMGFLLYIEGLRVVLEAPRADLRNDVRTMTMAWGENIESLAVARKLGVERRPAIVLTGYDPNTRKRIEVTYPENFEKRTVKSVEKTKKQTKATDINTKIRNSGTSLSKRPNNVNRGEYQVIPTNISNVDSLKRAARAYFMDLGRAERTVTLSTSDLRDSNGQSLLELRSGHAVALRFDDYNREMLASQAIGEQEKLDMLITRGFNADAAAVIVQHYTQLEAFARPLFVREVSFTYSAEEGLSIEMELVDFVTLQDPLKAEHVNENGQRLGMGSAQAEQAVLRGAQAGLLEAAAAGGGGGGGGGS